METGSTLSMPSPGLSQVTLSGISPENSPGLALLPSVVYYPTSRFFLGILHHKSFSHKTLSQGLLLGIKPGTQLSSPFRKGDAVQECDWLISYSGGGPWPKTEQGAGARSGLSFQGGAPPAGSPLLWGSQPGCIFLSLQRQGCQSPQVARSPDNTYGICCLLGVFMFYFSFKNCTFYFSHIRVR